MKIWDKIGLLKREIILYNNLSEYFKHIYIFTYGGISEKKYEKYLENNIRIIPMPFNITNHKSKVSFFIKLLYSFLLPFIHFKILKNINMK